MRKAVFGEEVLRPTGPRIGGPSAATAKLGLAFSGATLKANKKSARLVQETSNSIFAWVGRFTLPHTAASGLSASKAPASSRQRLLGLPCRQSVSPCGPK